MRGKREGSEGGRRHSNTREDKASSGDREKMKKRNNGGVKGKD